MSALPFSDLQTEIDAARQNIKTDGYPMSIGEISNLYRDGELDIHPEFQRFYRWNSTQKSRLIESILLGIPLPSIFVAQQPNGVWDVVDGLQRLSTIFQFMGILKDDNDEIVPPLVLESTKYLPALTGKKWNDPHDTDNAFTSDQQLYIKRSKINVQIILRESDSSAKYELFQRLNSSGSKLSDQELRNCLLISVNSGFYEKLYALSRFDSFQNCVPLTERLTNEQYDVELALRFIVLRNLAETDFTKIGSALGEYLTDQMISLAQFEGFDFESEETIFKKVFSILDQELGDDAFRKYDHASQKFTRGFSVSAFEVIALGLGHNDSAVPDNLRNVVIDQVWREPDFTSTGLPAARRLPTTLQRGRTVFGE